jgi:hypothetical protein
MNTLQSRANDLDQLLAKTKPDAWVEQGAPQAYVTQKNELSVQAIYLLALTRQLASHPERQSVALQVLFQLQQIEVHFGSLIDGVRSYQDAVLGEEMGRLWSANSQNRDRLRDYVIELSVLQEQEADVLRKEAQRCRSEINRRPADLTPPRKPKSAPAPPPK